MNVWMDVRSMDAGPDYGIGIVGKRLYGLRRQRGLWEPMKDDYKIFSYVSQSVMFFYGAQALNCRGPSNRSHRWETEGVRLYSSAYGLRHP